MSQKLKTVLSVLVILILLFGLYATFFGIGTTEDGKPLNGKNALKYGLDINGGVYVVMEGKTEGLGYSNEEINERYQSSESRDARCYRRRRSYQGYRYYS